MSIFFAFLACSICCTIGYIVGRCFRDLEAMALLQENEFFECENSQLRQALHKALGCMKQMQGDLEAVGGKSAGSDS